MQKRNVSIDIFKGLAIMLIVLGHLETTKLLHDFIFMFHVPAFFFVAGMTFHIKEEEPFFVFLKKKAYRLLMPYFFFTIIMTATQVVIDFYILTPDNTFYSFSFRKAFLAILDILVCGDIDGTFVTIGPAWFLYVLFISSLLFYALNVLKIRTIAIGVSIIALYIVSIKSGWFNRIPFKVAQSFSALFYMWCGRIFGLTITKIQHVKPSTLILFALSGMMVVLVSAWYLGDSINMVANHFPTSLFLVTIAALFGCISLYLLSYLIKQLKISRLIAFYGVNSMLILGLHLPLKSLFRLVFSRMGLSSQQSSIPVFFMIMIISLPLIIVVNKYAPFLVGMRKQKNTLQGIVKL